MDQGIWYNGFSIPPVLGFSVKIGRVNFSFNFIFLDLQACKEHLVHVQEVLTFIVQTFFIVI